MPFDALVMGAGPAGAVTARLLAQGGWHVALVEKAQFPRRKVCGEFLSATSLPLLQACGIADAYEASAGPVVTRVGLYAGNTVLASPRTHPWGRALNRATLDTLLRDAAVAAGVEMLQPGEVTTLRGRVMALGDGRERTARVMIVACGSWNISGPFAIATASDLFAFKAHFRDSRLPAGLMPLLAFPGGYGGMVHSDAGLTSLSFCLRRETLDAARRRHGGKAGEAALAHIRATTLGVDAALEGAALEGAILATGPIHPGLRPRVRDGVFVVGNLAGEAHPIVAEGISMAIQAGGLLAHLLLTGRESDYPRQWTRRFAPRIRAAALFAGLAMNGITRAAARHVITAFPQILDWGARRSGKR
jgi:flavin-dependent dehydrogenase